MKKITQLQKQIIEAHLKANFSSKLDNAFDYPDGSNELKTREDVIAALKQGKTIRNLHQEIAFRHVSMTSNLMASPNVFGHVSGAYRRDYTKGFKILLNNLNIQ